MVRKVTTTPPLTVVSDHIKCPYCEVFVTREDFDFSREMCAGCESTHCRRCDEKLPAENTLRICFSCSEARRAQRQNSTVENEFVSAPGPDDKRRAGYVGGQMFYNETVGSLKLMRRQDRAQERGREMRVLNGFHPVTHKKMNYCHICQMVLPLSGECDTTHRN